MNPNLPVSNAGAWPARPYDPEAGRLSSTQRNYSATNILDFATLVRIVLEWRWLILGAVAVGLAMAMVATLLSHRMYRASVTLEVNPPTTPITDNDKSGQDAQASSTFDLIATEVGLIQSRSVAQRTAQDLNLANNPAIVGQKMDPSMRLRAAADTVSRGLRVKAPESGQLIQFTYESNSPQLAAAIANGVADNLIATELQRRYESSAYARNFLERQINKTRADLEGSERSLVAYAQAQGIINTSSSDASQNGEQSGGDTSSLQGQSLVQLNQALAQATAQRVAAEGAYRQALGSGPTTDVAQSTMALQQQLALLQAQYQQKRTIEKPDHPEMVSLRSQIAELQKQISHEAAQVTSARTNTLLQQYRSALSAENALRARVAQLKGDVLNLRGRSIQYTILQRDVDTNRALYDALLQRYKEIGVAGGVGLAPVSIVDRADIPLFPFKPNLLLNLLVGLCFGVLAGVGGAIGIEFVNDTIKTREDVRKKLGLPCLGAVPRTSGKDAFVDDLRTPDSIISEAYSSMVAALRFSTESGTPKALLLTSTRSGEGKSSSALALAQNFARRGMSVLLIDSDLRKPAFKAADESVGLSKLLTTEDKIEGHVVETQHPNLWLLPSGPLPPSPADLLSTGRIRRVIAEAKERFGMVVIDGPPTLGLADAPLLAAAAGDVLFVIEARKTRARAAIEALNRLEVTGTRILGAVLTKAVEPAAHGYDRYGHYGYGYGKGSLKKGTEILMIPRGEDEAQPETAPEESDA